MSGDLILGIDSGKRGDLALVDLHTGDLVNVIDIPILQLKNKKVVDAYQLAAMIDEQAAHITEAWIERVWSRPGEGSVQAFDFGLVYGLLRGIVSANFIPLKEVLPAVWKRGAGVTGDKDESRQAASLRWPTETGRWPNKAHHGRAEAALIADYGRRQFLREHGQEAA
jgi:hypothetical protein